MGIRGCLNGLSSKWESYKLVAPFGKLIYQNLKINPELFKTKVFHVSKKMFVEDQLEEGKFSNKQLPVYFSHDPHKACFFRREEDDAVLLELLSNGPYKKDPLYKEMYFPAGEKQDIHIYRVWDVASDWKKQATEGQPIPSLYQRLKSSFQEGIKCYNQPK